MKKTRIYLSLFIFSFTLFLVINYCTSLHGKIVIFSFYPINLCFLLWSISEYTRKQKILMAFAISIVDLLLWSNLDSINYINFIPFVSAAIALFVSYIVDRK